MYLLLELLMIKKVKFSSQPYEFSRGFFAPPKKKNAKARRKNQNFPQQLTRGPWGREITPFFGGGPATWFQWVVIQVHLFYTEI